MSINLTPQQFNNVTQVQNPSVTPDGISQNVNPNSSTLTKIQENKTAPITSNIDQVDHVVTQRDNLPSKEIQETIHHSFRTGEPLNENVNLKETPNLIQRILNFFWRNTTSIQGILNFFRKDISINAQNLNASLSPDSALAKLDFNRVYRCLEENRQILGGDEPSNKRFLGISYETCQANIKNALKNKWGPQFFWNLCAKYFGVNKDEHCLYTHIKATLKSIEWVKDNYNSLQSISTSEAVERFEKETGQMWHPNLNSPESFFQVIDSIADSLDKLLFPENHSDVELTKRPNPLEVFQNAFSENNCCFPARQRPISDYYLQCLFGESQKIEYETKDDSGKLLEKTLIAIADKIVNLDYKTAFLEIKNKISEQITLREHDNAKVDKDITKNLQAILDANIVQYHFISTLYLEEDDLKETLGAINATKQQDGSWKFPDGSSLRFE